MFRHLTGLACGAVLATAPLTATAADGKYREAAAILRQALDRPADGDNLARGCREAAAKLGEQSYAGRALQAALEKYRGAKAAAALGEFRQALEGAASDLEFEPLMEAELPAGFPKYTPVGEVEKKTYPKYRLARVTSAGENTAFFQLFAHIKKNNIEMTAPVEMELREGQGGRLTQKTMAFLYGSPTLGQTGKAGAVEVVDVPDLTVVSTGVRGRDTQEQLRSARARLDQWLEDHPEYEKVGDVRVLGYNSPFVPAGRAYYEVQYEIRGKE